MKYHLFNFAKSSWWNPWPTLNIELPTYAHYDTNLLLILQYFSEILSNKSEYSAIYTVGFKDGNRSSIPSVIVFRHKDGLLRLPSAKSMIYSNSLIWQDLTGFDKSHAFTDFFKNEIEIINIWIPTDICVYGKSIVVQEPKDDLACLITRIIPYLNIYSILYFNMAVWIIKGPCSYGYPRTK